ncbi:MAG: hypothetical protein HKP56_09035 [Anderseniella sp.]|nr:hypothetical protein [Anderseniella sp.]
MQQSATKFSGDLPAGPAGMPHLAGPAADLRQAMAAHFVDGLPTIVEIGGHLRPVSGFLRHVPERFVCVDPKSEPFESDKLNGEPCRVRHIARKFQEVDLDLKPGSYGLVFVGYSLKAFGSQDAVGQKLFSLIDNSALTVIEFSPKLQRASKQMQSLLERPEMETVCSLDFSIEDGAFETTEYGARRLVVLRPATSRSDAQNTAAHA